MTSSYISTTIKIGKTVAIIPFPIAMSLNHCTAPVIQLDQFVIQWEGCIALQCNVNCETLNHIRREGMIMVEMVTKVFPPVLKVMKRFNKQIPGWSWRVVRRGVMRSDKTRGEVRVVSFSPTLSNYISRSLQALHCLAGLNVTLKVIATQCLVEF